MGEEAQRQAEEGQDQHHGCCGYGFALQFGAGVRTEKGEQATPAAESGSSSAENQSNGVEVVLLVNQAVDGPAAGKATGEGEASQGEQTGQKASADQGHPPGHIGQVGKGVAGGVATQGCQSYAGQDQGQGAVDEL